MEQNQGQIVPFVEKFRTVAGLLEKMRPQIAAALPKHMTPDKMLRTVLTSIRRNPKLLECETRSLFGAVLELSQLGLVPDGILGSAHLIPFKVKGKMLVQAIPGYKGLIDLAMRSGKVEVIDAEVVYTGDEFRYERGLNPSLHHVPTEADDPGTLRATYAVAQMVGGGRRYTLLLARDVKRIRKSSQSFRAGFGPWTDENEPEMWKKTAIRRLCKMLPLSPDIQLQIAREEILERGDDPSDSSEFEEILLGDGEDGNGSSGEPEAPKGRLDTAIENLRAAGEAEGEIETDGGRVRRR